MLVKDLIEKLKTLDQDKEIKTVWAGGYEYEESTSSDVEIQLYEDTRIVRDNGTSYFDIGNDTDDTDFYLIQ